MEPGGIIDQQCHRKRNWIAMIFTVFILLVIGGFAYRVVHFITLIRTGDMEALQSTFLRDQTSSSTLANVDLPQGIFQVVSQDDPFLGTQGAAITIVEFGDFSCAYCRDSSYIMRSLMQKYGDDVFYQFRDFPVADMHPLAQTQSEAAVCAHAQGKFWEYHDKLFQSQNDMSEERLVSLALEVGLDQGAFVSCLEEGDFAKEVLEDYQAGVAAGVRGTPTFFINGNRIAGSIPQDVLELLIHNQLEEE
ncbi:TPA: hypothetical protein DEP34_01365 [Candidatus Uhrbacteria bacterium]|nr:hypothetical protein [Candidatus Uhrbacteria bacterium]HCB19018.1 hypothetical protein [Candidatus Uhrbacteria bacterium]